jgi:hypothetical protein
MGVRIRSKQDATVVWDYCLGLALSSEIRKTGASAERFIGPGRWSQTTVVAALGAIKFDYICIGMARIRVPLESKI